MIVRTRIFELGNGRYKNLREMAQAMGISVSQLYRVRQGTRHINQKFIVGAIQAFPGYRLDDLFYLTPDLSNTSRRNSAAHFILQKRNGCHGESPLDQQRTLTKESN